LRQRPLGFGGRGTQFIRLAQGQKMGISFRCFPVANKLKSTGKLGGAAADAEHPFFGSFALWGHFNSSMFDRLFCKLLFYKF